MSGIGNLDEPLRRLASKLGVLDRVRFLGFREDIPEILAATDIFVFPSLREGLPLALMEAMAAGLPVVCSNIRGNRDLIEHGKGGYLAEPNVEQFAFFIEKLLSERAAWRDMGGWNMRVIDGFDEERVKACMRAVYASFGDALCERSK